MGFRSANDLPYGFSVWFKSGKFMCSETDIFYPTALKDLEQDGFYKSVLTSELQVRVS